MRWSFKIETVKGPPGKAFWAVRGNLRLALIREGRYAEAEANARLPLPDLERSMRKISPQRLGLQRQLTKIARQAGQGKRQWT